MIELLALAIFTAALPALGHLAGLGAAPIVPRMLDRSNKAEQLIFRCVQCLWLANGALLGVSVFLWKSGAEAPALMLIAVACPTIVLQVAALAISKSRDLAERR